METDPGSNERGDPQREPDQIDSGRWPGVCRGRADRQAGRSKEVQAQVKMTVCAGPAAEQQQVRDEQADGSDPADRCDEPGHGRAFAVVSSRPATDPVRPDSPGSSWRLTRVVVTASSNPLPY